MTQHQYIVTLPLGGLCQKAGLPVDFRGAEATVAVRDWREYESFWAQRLTYLRANPLAE